MGCAAAVVSVRRGAARRGGAGGWATCACDADSVPAGAAGDERGGARSRPARCAFLGACFSWASAAGRNGRASLMASELGRPLDNQAAAPCAWGWFLLHPYGGVPEDLDVQSGEDLGLDAFG